MAEQSQTNDQSLYETVDALIKMLLPLDPSERLRAHRTVGAFFGFEDSYIEVNRNAGNRASQNVSREPKFSSSDELTPKEFLLEKKPQTEVERVACLAHYLSHYRDVQQFKTIDISKLNTEAAQTKLSNASYTIGNAVRAGYLAAAAKGMKQLSAQGEQYVEALPDRDAAKEVKLRKSKRSRKKSRANQVESDLD